MTVCVQWRNAIFPQRGMYASEIVFTFKEIGIGLEGSVSGGRQSDIIASQV